MNPIRLASPSDVLAVLPYQLGYHPHDAVVVVTVRERAVGLVERIDLPPPEHVAEAADALVAPLLADPPDAALLVGYETVDGASRELLDQVQRGCGLAGIDVLDRLAVRDGRWYSLDCTDGCCPQDGTPLPDAAGNPAVAELVALGVSPLPSRRAVAAVVAEDPDLAPSVRRALTRRRGGGLARAALPPASVRPASAAQRRAWLVQWAAVLDVGPEATPVERTTPGALAELVLSLEDVELRDGVIARWCPDTLPLDALGPELAHQLRTLLPAPAWADHDERGRGEGAEAGRRALARLEWVARAVPDEDAAAVLTVLASFAWWLGDGAVAREALDRALGERPDYRLARLLERMVDLGVRSRPERPPRRGLATSA